MFDKLRIKANFGVSEQILEYFRIFVEGVFIKKYLLHAACI